MTPACSGHYGSTPTGVFDSEVYVRTKRDRDRDRQTDRQRHRQADRQTDRQTDRQRESKVNSISDIESLCMLFVFRFMIVELYGPPEERNLYFDYGADMPFNFGLVTSLDNHYQVHHNFCDAICIRDVIKNEYDTLPEGKWANFVVSLIKW